MTSVNKTQGLGSPIYLSSLKDKMVHVSRHTVTNLDTFRAYMYALSENPIENRAYRSMGEGFLVVYVCLPLTTVNVGGCGLC